VVADKTDIREFGLNRPRGQTVLESPLVELLGTAAVGFSHAPCLTNIMKALKDSRDTIWCK